MGEIRWHEEGQPEVPLAGGDVTVGVVRIGDTVRRPAGPHSPLVHALLAHLELAGFKGAPRFLGIDGAGREVLSYVDGEYAVEDAIGPLSQSRYGESIGSDAAGPGKSTFLSLYLFISLPLLE